MCSHYHNNQQHPFAVILQQWSYLIPQVKISLLPVILCPQYLDFFQQVILRCITSVAYQQVGGNSSVFVENILTEANMVN